MVDSNYFIRGYAIHGYAKCPPTPPATAACACRSPTPPAIYAWVQTGTPVDVYNETGGGSNSACAATPVP